MTATVELTPGSVWRIRSGYQLLAIGWLLFGVGGAVQSNAWTDDPFNADPELPWGFQRWGVVALLAGSTASAAGLLLLASVRRGPFGPLRWLVPVLVAAVYHRWWFDFAWTPPEPVAGGLVRAGELLAYIPGREHLVLAVASLVFCWRRRLGFAALVWLAALVAIPIRIAFSWQTAHAAAVGDLGSAWLFSAPGLLSMGLLALAAPLGCLALSFNLRRGAPRAVTGSLAH